MARNTYTLEGPNGKFLLTFSREENGYSVIRQEGSVLTPLLGPLTFSGMWATYEDTCDLVVPLVGYDGEGDHEKIRQIIKYLDTFPGDNPSEDPAGL